MARIETWFDQDLNSTVKVRYIDGNLFSQDNAGNLIGIRLHRNGVPYSGGGTVSASVIRADGVTVAVPGSLSGNVATVVLPQAAYAILGAVSIIVKLTVSGAVTTISASIANVYQSSTDTVVDPGTIIPSIETLIAEIEAAIASIPADYSGLWGSLAPVFSADSSYIPGQYVTYNGGLYRFDAKHSGTWNSAHVTQVTIGGSIVSLLANIAPVFNESSSYIPGQFATYDGRLYRFFANHSGEWNNAHATQVTTGDSIVSMLTNIAPVFNAGINYAEGQYVTHDNGLYILTSYHAAGTAWSATSKRQATAGETLSILSETDADIKTGLFYTKRPVYPADINTASFVQSTGNGYWGKKRLLDPCYIKKITIYRGSDTTEQQCSVIFCDKNYVVLKKVYVVTSESTVDVSVGYNAEVPFYVLIRLPGMLYMQANETKYIAKTLKADFATAGYAIPGDTVEVTEETSNLEFDARLTITPIAKQIEENRELAREEFSFCPTNRWENFATGNLAGDNVWGSKLLYPAGFIKSISLMIGNTTAEDVAIYITDKNKKILKKVFGYQGETTGEFTYVVNFLAVEPVYIFVRAVGMIWLNSGALLGEEYAIWSGAWGTYGYKAEGETLFDSWNNGGALSTVLFAIRANYKNSDAEKYEKRERLYTLKNAYTHWLWGEKFPMCVIGDSTTDGDTTTGATPNVLGTDHVDPNTYTTKLQEFLRASLNNSVLRIYNAGFSGRGVSWALQNIDSMLFDNQYYQDTKIAVISHGINDNVTSYNSERWYRGHLEQLVNVLYDAGIQPVMMTTQAGMENYGRFGWKQMSVADSITKEVAEKYNLEVMDKNTVTAFFNVYSGLTIQQIIPDGCHYSDAGHLFVAGYMFSELVPYTVRAGEGETILGFDSEQIKTELQYSSFAGYIWKDVKQTAITNGFKLKADCTKEAATTLMDFYVFVYDKVPKKLKSYCTAANGQKVIVDGSEYSVSSAEQEICNLEIGLHHVVVTAPAGDINYYGLKVVNR